jgi:hypothetical protein
MGILAAALGGVVTATSLAHAQRPSATACGGSTWRLTTLSDPQRNQVALGPRSTTIGAIVARGTPQPLPHRRSTPFQRQTWTVIGQIAEFKLIGNVIHLALSDDGTYVDGSLPSPSCLPLTTRARAAIVAAWTSFTNQCGHHPTDKYQPLGAVAYITGVGSWTNARGHGLAPNGAALGPVTGLRIIAGCH